MNGKDLNKFIERIKRLQKLDLLISSKTTGTLETLAKTLQVSESVIEKDLELMNQKGARITCDFVNKTYYYAIPGKFFSAGWMRKTLKNMIKIKN